MKQTNKKTVGCCRTPSSNSFAVYLDISWRISRSTMKQSGCPTCGFLEVFIITKSVIDIHMLFVAGLEFMKLM